MDLNEGACPVVMLLDDDPMANFITSGTIRLYHDDVNIVSFENIQDSLAHLKNAGLSFPDIILLDLNLYGESGWDFIPSLRQMHDQGLIDKIPVIAVLSSSISEIDRKNAEAFEEVKEFIAKPFKPEYCEILLGLLAEK